MKIYKQILAGEERQTIEVPAGTEFLTAQVQNSAICVWYKCDPDNPPMQRSIAIVPTGGTPPETVLYLGTCMFMDGQIVLHVFEVVE
jgi:hypothetical protein